MILHIYVADKFIPPYVSFVNRNFPSDEHVHFIVNRKNRFEFEANSNLVVVNKLNLITSLKLQTLFRKADKVILHGLFWDKIVRLLAVNYGSLKKCYWVMWGGDLYRYKNRHKKLKSRLMHYVKRFVISRLGHFITYLPEDYELAKKWYGANGEYHECLLYLSNVFNSTAHVPIESKNERKKNVLLGNSASLGNRHSEALKYLLPFKNKIRIHTPLTYGNMKYAQKVINEGNYLFEGDFCAMTKHIPLEEYYNFLGSIDLVIFNHDRQQGMGNLIQLLALGKKVFIDFSTTQKSLFDALGITVYNVEKIDLEDLDDETKKSNIMHIKDYFTEARFMAQWKSIFSS